MDTAVSCDFVVRLLVCNLCGAPIVAQERHVRDYRRRARVQPCDRKSEPTALAHAGHCQPLRVYFFMISGRVEGQNSICDDPSIEVILGIQNPSSHESRIVRTFISSEIRRVTGSCAATLTTVIHNQVSETKSAVEQSINRGAPPIPITEELNDTGQGSVPMSR